MASRSTASSRPASRKHLRAWSRLRLLCCSGLPLVSVAPELLATVRGIVPNAAGALFLTSHEGVPHAFFHEDSPEDVRALFLHEPGLFAGPREHNVFRLVGGDGSRLGQLLRPPEDYFRSNTYQLLVRASGHHHTLDARLEVDGRRAGMVSLFREPGRGFDEDELDTLGRVAQHLEHALKGPASESLEAPADAETAAGTAMLVCTPDGRLQFASADARAWLDTLPMAGPAWPDRRALPPFCARLVARLHRPEHHGWALPEATVPTAGGWLRVTAQWMSRAAPDADDGSPDGLVAVLLQRLVPPALSAWRRLAGMDLSPREAEVAFWLARDGDRDAVRARLGVGEAVLRDALKTLYAGFGVHGQDALVAALRRPAAAAAHPGRPVPLH